jgi:hypothetical protein
MFEAEALIRQRLTGIAGVAGVHSMAELSLDSVAGRRLPAIFVAPDGYRVLDAASARARVAVRWLVVVAVASASRVREGDAVRADAANIVRAAFARLLGWQPSPEWQPMMPTAAPRPEYAAGTLLWPLAFEAAQVIEREP